MVMCGRRDDKRGDFAGRLQNSLDFLISQAGAAGAPLEVVIVEWNPQPRGEPLASLLRVPHDSPVVVRVITVPAWRHASVQNGTGQDFFEFMAKVPPRSSPRSRSDSEPEAALIFGSEGRTSGRGEHMASTSFSRTETSSSPTPSSPSSRSAGVCPPSSVKNPTSNQEPCSSIRQPHPLKCDACTPNIEP